MTNNSRPFFFFKMKGFDVLGDDPREVVQNLLFGEADSTFKPDEMSLVSKQNTL